MNDYKSPGVVIFIAVVLFLLLSAIPAQAVTIPASDIKSAVQKYVTQKSPWPPDRLRVLFLTTVSDERFSEKSVSLTVSGRAGDDFIDYTPFTVGFYANGLLLKEISVRVTIEVLADVVMSKRVLSRGSPIQAGDLYVQKKWLKRPPAHLAGFAEIVGKSVKTTIGANREIKRNMLDFPTLVKKGAVVKILLDNKAISIAAIGMSEEEGTYNEIIRVKNLSSNRIIYARVAAENTVLIDF